MNLAQLQAVLNHERVIDHATGTYRIEVYEVLGQRVRRIMECAWLRFSGQTCC